MRNWLSALFLAASAAPVLSDDANPILGTWVTPLTSEITVAPCETGLCGYLTRIVVPEERYIAHKSDIDAIGIENLTDYNNPDPALKVRPLLGLPILNLTRQITPGSFEGEIYNPEDGGLYSGRLDLIDADAVRLTGCAFVILCQSQDWVRAPEIVDETPIPGTARMVWPPLVPVPPAQ